MANRPWLPPLAYTASLVPLVLAAHACAALAFAASDRLPPNVQRANWVGYALNVAAPAAGGVAVAIVAIALLIRLRQFAPTLLGFALRTLPWWLLASGIVVIVVREQSNRDFGLWSQIITWPLMALVASLATDAIWTVYWRNRMAAV